MSAAEQGPTRRIWQGARPVERKFGLDDLGVRASVRALTDGGSPIVHSRPAGNGGFGDRARFVGEGGLAAIDARNGEDMVSADDIVRALLAVSHRVAVGKVVAGQALVAGKPSALEKF